MLNKIFCIFYCHLNSVLDFVKGTDKKETQQAMENMQTRQNARSKL